jgi:2-amino-4-hydroxy-6-hydroxymethyldihydropteridine diphosphokinase
MDDALVILSLGSNIEPRKAFLEKALQELTALPKTQHLRCSSIYETVPVGVPEAEGGHLFLNAVVVLETSLTPRPFLAAIQAIEERLGRTRTGLYGAARTLDIDIIAFGDTILNTPDLTLPHPRAHHRAFVLQPLAELLPDYKLPGHPQNVMQLLGTLASTP